MIEKETSQRKDRIWIVILCCVMIMFTGYGFCSSTKQLFLTAITKAQGIERSLFSFNDTCRYGATAIVSIFFGRLIQKLGPKKMALMGFGLLIASQVLYALSDALILYYVAGLLLGCGLGMAGSSTISYILHRRCASNVGTIQGFVLATNGLGGALAVQLLSPIIESGLFGYRNAFWLVAAILTAVMLLFALLFREDTSKPHTVTQKKARGQTWEGISFSYGKRRPWFYIAMALTFFTGMVVSAVNGFSVAHMKDVGIDPDYVATVWSVHALALVCCKFLVGFSYDRAGLRAMLLLCHGAALVALLSLAFAAPTTLGVGLAWVYSLLSPMATGMETVGAAMIVSDLYGNRDYAKFLGINAAVNAAGMAIGNPLFNRMQELFGSYVPAILTAAAVIGTVMISFQFLISFAHKERARVAAGQIS